LTVRQGQATFAQGQGLGKVHDAVYKSRQYQRRARGFYFVGRLCGQKESLIDTAKHTVLKSVHPSPLSAENGFFGSAPFSKAERSIARSRVAAKSIGKSLTSDSATPNQMLISTRLRFLLLSIAARTIASD
jgi:uracil-DNA glycosylase